MNTTTQIKARCVSESLDAAVARYIEMSNGKAPKSALRGQQLRIQALRAELEEILQ